MDETDEDTRALSCSYCRVILSEAIKYIPECGKNICGGCYEILKVDVDQETKKYVCNACGNDHAFPLEGLRDNELVLALLVMIKTHRKPLHPNAIKLKKLIREMEAKFDKVQSFEGKQFIELHCEQLELEVAEMVLSAIDHLKMLEKKILKDIDDYREETLNNLINSPTESSWLKAAQLEREINEFNARWKKYFKQIDAYETESDISDAVDKTVHFISRIESIEENLRMEAFNWNKLVFCENSKFMEGLDYIGETKIEILVEPVSKEQTHLSETDSQADLSFISTSDKSSLTQVSLNLSGDKDELVYHTSENCKKLEIFQLQSFTPFGFQNAQLKISLFQNFCFLIDDLKNQQVVMEALMNGLNFKEDLKSQFKSYEVFKRDNFLGNGLEIIDEKSPLAESKILVYPHIKVEPNGPAEEAGLKNGQRLVAVNGLFVNRELKKLDEVVQEIEESFSKNGLSLLTVLDPEIWQGLMTDLSSFTVDGAGTEKKLEPISQTKKDKLVDRNEKTFAIKKLTISRRSNEKLGMNLADEKIDNDIPCPFVISVLGGSAAEDAGLKKGDIIIEINATSTVGKKAATLASLMREDFTDVTIVRDKMFYLM